MRSDEFLLIISVFVLTVATLAALYRGLDWDLRPMHRRLRELAVRIRLTEGTYAAMAPLGIAELVAWIERRMPVPRREKASVEKVISTLQYAGYYSPVAAKMFVLIRLAAAVAGVLLGYAFAVGTGRTGLSRMVWTAAIASLGYLVPLYYVRRMARSRQVQTRRQLPDAIDLLVVCAECGLGIAAAIKMVGLELERQGRILGAHIVQLSSEMASGRTLGDGFRAMAARTGVEEIRSVAAILSQSEKLGSEMAQALRAISAELRAQRSTKAEEAAHKLPVKMIIPVVGLLLPAMMLIVVGPIIVQLYRTFNQFYR